MKCCKLVFFLFLCIGLLLFSLSRVFASEESIQELKEEILMMKQKIAELEKRLDEESKVLETEKKQVAKQEAEIQEYRKEFEGSYDDLLKRTDKKSTFERDDFKIGAQVTFIGQGADNANLLGSDKENKFDGSYQADLSLEKKWREIDGRAFVNFRAGQGKGADRFLVLYSGVDNNASDDKHLWVQEMFYEQNLFDNRAIVNIGKIDPTDSFDQNRLAGSDAYNFLGAIFNNNPAIEFPGENLAVRLGVMLFEWLELNYLALNGNDDWEDIDDHLFNIGQLTFKPDFFDREGYYRFIVWHNNNPHIKWKDPTETNKGTYGLGLSFDQDINDIISLFARYGWENPDVYNPDITATGDNLFSIEQSWSGGIQLKGIPWGREKDLLGFAVGQVIPSDDYKEALDRKGKSEGHLEIYYDINLNDHFYISPDFQYILNPYGKDVEDNDDPVFVYGIRTHIDF